MGNIDMDRQSAMRRTTVITLGLACLWGTSISCAQALPAPDAFESALSLCPEALEKDAYNTDFLESFTTLVQGKDGWLFRSDVELGYDFGPAESALPELKRFADALRQAGTELMVVAQPTRGLVHRRQLPDDSVSYDYDRAAKAYADALERFRSVGIATPDLTSLLNENESQGYFFKRDHHWTPYGAQRTARLVADSIQQLPLYEGLAKKTFSTQRVGYLTKDGTLGMAASKLCGVDHPIQTVPSYQTEANDNEGAALDLFSDAGEPQVTIVGTSNTKSNVNYNFTGFLQEYLSLDILNEAMAGGGFNGALEQYLPSVHFQETPPKLLIWEVPSYHLLGNETFYRQIIPAVFNGCENQRVTLQNTVSLKPGGNEIFNNASQGILPLKSRDYLLDLQISDASINKFKVFVWYLNGKKEKVSIDRNARIAHEGRHYLELSQKPQWANETFLALELEMPETLPEGVSVTARLCQRPDL